MTTCAPDLALHVWLAYQEARLLPDAYDVPF